MDQHQSPWESGEWTAIVDSIQNTNAIVGGLRDMTLDSKFQNEQDEINDDMSDDDMYSNPEALEPLPPEWQLIEREHEIERASRESPNGPSALDMLINSLPTVTEFLREEIGYDPLVDGIPEAAQFNNGRILAPALPSEPQETEENLPDSDMVSEAGSTEDSGLEPLLRLSQEDPLVTRESGGISSITVLANGTGYAQFSTAHPAEDFEEPPETSNLPTWSQFRHDYLENPELLSAAAMRRKCCPVCKESFRNLRKSSTDPTKLPCAGGHSICIECARHWFTRNRECSGHEPQQRNACPVCREKLYKFDIPVYYEPRMARRVDW